MEAEGRVAAIIRVGANTVDELLAEKVVEWRSAGARAVGVLAKPRAEPRRMAEQMSGGTCSAGYLRDIANGEEQGIFLPDAPPSASCDLDDAAVDAACRRLIGQIPNSDIVVLSKFGKLEAEGGGLLPAFRAAIAAGKPVLTSVSERHLSMWRAFAPHPVALTNPEEVDTWWSALNLRPSEAPA